MIRTYFVGTFLFLFVALQSGCTGFVESGISSPSEAPINSATPSVSSLALSEGQSATFTVTLNKPTSSDMTINWAIQSNSSQNFSLWEKIKQFALSSSDFVQSNGSMTIASGSSQASITIDSLVDGMYEGSEVYDVVITGSGFMGQLTIPLTITDSDTAPVLTPLNAYVNEGESAILLFKLDKRSEAETSFQIQLIDDSAIANTDFTPPTQLRIVIPANTLIYGIEVPTVNNSVFTGDKRFKVNLSNATGATIGTAEQSVFILDDEAGPRVTVSNLTVSEGDGFAEATVTLSEVSQSSVLFDWTTEEKVAAAGSDYVATSASDVVIPAGSTSVKLRVPVIDDPSDELDETFKVLLANVRNASLDDYEAIVTIADNDNPPAVQWNVLTQSVNEGVGIVTVRAELSDVSGKTVTANIAISGTANSSDHNFGATSISILPGVAYKDLEFQVNNDNLAAATKTLILTLSSPNNANLGGNTVHTVNIVDDDGTPLLFVGNATVAESAGTVQIPVSLGSGLESGESVTFNWTVSNGTAVTPGDFSATTGSVTINGPASVANLPVTINNDTNYEGPETFSVSIDSASGNATIQSGADTGYITITDDEAQPNVQFNLASQTVSEAVGSATAVLTLSQTVGSNVVIPYTVTGTATYGTSGTADHELAGGVITIPAGSTTTILVIPVTNDSLSEVAETIVVTLQTPSSGAMLGTQKIHTVTVNDNDSNPTINIANASAIEGGNLNLSVTLSAMSGRTVTADYTLADGTATHPADFDPSSMTGTVTFYPGETTKYISIPTVDNATTDGSRNFSVTLSNLANATLATSSATGTINDNEGPLTISINDSAANEGQNVTFTVTLSGPSSSAVTVNYATADGDSGTASENATIANSDYAAKSDTLTIPAGQTTGSIVVATTSDTSYESNEKFKITLSSPSTGSFSDATGYGTITNDDSVPTIEFALASSSITEDAGTHSLTVTLGQAQSESLTVNFAFTGTADGSGTDYSTSTSSPITFAPGETSKTIALTIVNDSAVESPETIIATLSGPSGAGAVLGAKTVHTVTITDNDTAPSVTSFSPGSGNVSGIPTSVQVTFDRAMQTASVQNSANWDLVCQSGSVSFGSISLATNVATVNLNVGTQPNAGDNCVLEAKTSMLDNSSNTLGGTAASRKTTYTKVTPASVTSVTSSTSDGYYKAGQTINVSVVFNEVITVTGGTPTITLETGGSDAVVSLSVGSGTTTLQGTYTIGSGENSNDLNYVGTSSLVANGASIKNVSNVEADLTLPSTVSGSSLGGSKALVVDTTAPSAPASLVDGLWMNSLTASPTVTFTAGTDGNGIDHHEARVVLGSNTATAMSSWASFSSGATIGSLSLTDAVQYKVQIKAVDRAGNESTEATSDGWTVDVTTPTAPTGVTLGAVPSSATASPTITYTAGTDAGGSGIANHQVKIIKTSDSSVAQDWTNHTSGDAITGINPVLVDSAEYSVLVRSSDNAGNVSAQTTAVSWTVNATDPCDLSPTAGTVCVNGTIFAGALSPGATSGSGTDLYMTTPGGCEDVPNDGNRGGTSSSNYYTTADFTPTCSGTDSLSKTWNDGTTNFFDLPGLTNYTSSAGSIFGASNTDQYYGDRNSTHIVNITNGAQGGYHAAARYCDKLVYGGYSDWYLPNRYELNLLYTNRTSITGFNLTGVWYWSSTEYDGTNPWFLRSSDGFQTYYNTGEGKKATLFVRCVRRYNKAPSDLLLGLVSTSLTETPTLNFTPPPANGSVTPASYEAQLWNSTTGTVVSDWAPITNGGKRTGLALNSGDLYYFVLRAVGSNGAKWSSIASGTWKAGMSCPAGYVQVPPLAGYTSSVFCVGKYEAKNVGNIAISEMAGVSWVGIQRGTDATSAGGAWKACRDNGGGYDLISNAQWQTIARNIADVPWNWSTGIAYSGELNIGQAIYSPTNFARAASTDDDACSGTGQTCSDTVWHAQRRTNQLSNGQTIWDIGGNAQEWVTDNNSVSHGANGNPSTFNQGDSRQVNFGNDQFCESPTSSPYCGMGYGNTNYTAGAIRRGGSWHSAGGIFSSHLTTSAGYADSPLGFRCVYQP